jgi:hypothetical protein
MTLCCPCKTSMASPTPSPITVDHNLQTSRSSKGGNFVEKNQQFCCNFLHISQHM